MKIDDYKLYEIASEFRDAIEKAKADRKFVNDCRFTYFPRGCYDDASALLSEYLNLFGIKCKIVEGTYYDDNPEFTSSHGWIELPDGRVIDITGDQFKYDPVIRFSEAVYLGEYTEFHRMFNENMFTEEQGIHNDGEVRRRRLEDLYNTICEYLEQDNV